MNPSDLSILEELAYELAQKHDDFSVNQFKQDLTSSKIEGEFKRQRDLAQQISTRGYPSLVLKYADTHYFIEHDYLNANAVLNNIKHVLNQSN
jgi:protein-disulfide isomerase-like protein with CxxC motif